MSTQYHRKPRATNFTTRKCMCCRGEFKSEGIHNRLCGGCKSSSAAWASTNYAAFHATARRSPAQ